MGYTGDTLATRRLCSGSWSDLVLFVSERRLNNRQARWACWCAGISLVLAAPRGTLVSGCREHQLSRLCCWHPVLHICNSLLFKVCFKCDGRTMPERSASHLPERNDKNHREASALQCCKQFHFLAGMTQKHGLASHSMTARRLHRTAGVALGRDTSRIITSSRHLLGQGVNTFGD